MNKNPEYRFRQTLSDLEWRAEDMENGIDEDGNDKPISEEEKEARSDLIRVCQRIVDNYSFYLE